MAFILVLIVDIIKTAFYATIWYAALCIIKDYHKKAQRRKAAEDN